MNRFPCIVTALVLLTLPAQGQNRIDRIRPDAPELSAHGSYGIGVRTIEVVHADQIDILSIEEGAELPRYDRPLTLEVWYPTHELGEPTPYENVFLRDGQTSVTLHGRAVRDAEPTVNGAPFPLILISHGYPGNRFLLSHLGENLASKGYVVASIDHTDSTYRTRAAFGSTLVNRTLDQLFVLDRMATFGAQAEHWLEGRVDAERTGLIGYSMGGYGAVITAGGGITAASASSPEGSPAGTLAMHQAGTATHEALFDGRIKAVVAFAPWGMASGLWNTEGLAGVRIPMLLVAGSVDDVSGYQGGVRAIFEQITQVDRYLLTFENANHNAAAPIPAPAESWGNSSFGHYADPVWDTSRMNNIAQHFVTAYLGLLLKGDADMAAYLDLVPRSGDGIWSLGEDGIPTPEHTYWKGFDNRTAAGLRLEKLTAE